MHEYYGSGIKKISADFELTFPKYDLDDSDAFKFEFEIARKYFVTDILNI